MEFWIFWGFLGFRHIYSLCKSLLETMFVFYFNLCILDFQLAAVVVIFWVFFNFVDFFLFFGFFPFFFSIGMLTISDFINILRHYYKSPLVRSCFLQILFDMKENIRMKQCSSQSAPLCESRKRSRDGPHQKRSRAILALSFFNCPGSKWSLLLQLQ